MTDIDQKWQPSTTDTYASYRLWGSGVDTAQVAAAVGKPSSGRRLRNPDIEGPKYALSSKNLVPSNNLNDHLRWLLEQLSPAAAMLGELVRDGIGRADFFCYWREHGQHGPQLTPDVLRGMGDLGADLWIDVYCPYGDEPGDDAPEGDRDS